MNQPTSALAQMDPPPELQDEIAAVVKWSAANQIASANDYQRTADHLKEIKRAQNQVAEFFDQDIQRAHEIHKSLCGKKASMLAPLKASEEIDKRKMISYQRAEQEKAEAERRRLQAEADERARREREALEKRAAAAKKPETKERLMEQAEAVAAPVIAVAVEAPKIAGIATRKTWKAEIVDLEAFLRFAVESKRYDLIVPNTKVIDSLAKGLKERASLPGVDFTEVESLAASGR